MRLASMIAVCLALAGCEASHMGEDEAGVDASAPIDAAQDAVALVDAFVPVDSGPCGNGRMDPGEVCDDGNAIGGDGCRADCLGTEQCGDGFVDVGEVCLPQSASTMAALVNTGMPLQSFAGHALADVDRDGDLDVMFALARQGGGLGLAAMLNDGHGQLSPPVDVGLHPTGFPVFAVLDLNVDGAADYVTSTATGPEIWLSDGVGGFGASAQVLTHLALGVFADQDGDGDVDLIAADTTSAQLVVLANDGHGRLAMTTTLALPITPVQVVSLQFDGDAKPDLLAIDAAGTGYVLAGRSGRTFGDPRRVMQGVVPGYALPEVGDLDGDGDDDLVMGAATVATLVENASGMLAANGDVPARWNAYAVRMDGDDAVDVVSSSAAVWLSTAPFGVRGPVWMPDGLVAIGVADMNGDGANDVVAAASPTETMNVYLADP